MTEILRVEPLRQADHAVWLQLWNAYLRFYETILDEDVKAITWARLLDNNEPMGGFIAWRGADAVGLVHHVRHRSAWTVGDYCYLQDLFVDPAQRGGGVGRQLIEKVYKTAAAMECSSVYWLTHETNNRAMMLYDRIGKRSGFVHYQHILTAE